MERRDFLKAAGCGTIVAAAHLPRPALAADGAKTKESKPVPKAVEKLDKEMATKKADAGLKWYDVRDWGVEGKGWSDTERYFDRLPAKAKTMVRPPVWALIRHSAGMCVRFETDAAAVSARWTLLSKRLAMTHMPATGVSGLDLYARDDSGRWHWLAVGRPAASPHVSARLVGGLPRKRRECMLYLPLYNGVERLEIGLPRQSSLWPLKPRADKPIVFYGTSIMQGGCASRPGMAHSAILGRWLDKPIINLGFSGNGTMDPEMGELMAELDPCLYFIDCLPNMGGDLVAKRAAPLVSRLREARGKTPIVLVEDRTYANTPLLPSLRSRNASRRDALRKAYQQLQSSGIGNLHYIPGEALIGDDGEATVDGSHPTDLGFMRMAHVLEPVLRPLL